MCAVCCAFMFDGYARIVWQFHFIRMCVRTQTCITLRDLLQMVNGFFEPTRTQLVCSELEQISKINSVRLSYKGLDVKISDATATLQLFIFVREKQSASITCYRGDA